MAQVKKGKWRDVDVGELEKLYRLPQVVQKHMKEANPDWDWIEVSEGKDKDTWLIIRQFEDGKETERVAAVIKARKFLD